MENRLSYIMVGLFVFVLLLAGVGSILWLGNYSDKGNFKFYKVATKESVSGLNEKAPVKLNGVTIGEVRGITINPKNAEEVLVVVRVQESAPIKDDTYALIQPQGITGLSFIELKGGTNDAQALKTSTTPNDYGIIPSQPSAFSRLDKTVTSLSNKAEVILARADEILSEKNIKHLEMILENSAKISNSTAKTLENIEQHNKEISHILKEAVVFEKAAIDAARSIQTMSETLSKTINSTGIDTLESVKNVMLHFDEKIKKGAFDVDLLLKDNLIPLQTTLDELRILSIESRALIDHLNDSPSDLFFKSADIHPAPNETRSPQ
jgi:phospholipid/cholesterol/gamma-HCH transport system substrate-binding protein